MRAPESVRSNRARLPSLANPYPRGTGLATIRLTFHREELLADSSRDRRCATLCEFPRHFGRRRLCIVSNPPYADAIHQPKNTRSSWGHIAPKQPPAKVEL